MSERRYTHPEPRFWSVRLGLMVVPFAAGIAAAGLRTAAAAYLVSYWGWPEAVAVAGCIEFADLAFLLRWVWTRENGRQDLLAACGMAMGVSSSIAFSVVLAFVATERLSLATRMMGQAAAIIAAVGVNVVTYLLGREIAVYVVESEAEHARWEEKRLEWVNRGMARAERKANHEIHEQHEQEKRRRVPETPAEREIRLLEMYGERAEWSQAEMEAQLGCGKSAAYELRKRMVLEGKLDFDGKGGFRVVHEAPKRGCSSEDEGRTNLASLAENARRRGQ